MTKPRWLELAEAELGTKEVVGKADNPRIMAYYADAGHPEIAHDEVAWCAAFTNAMLARAGLRGTNSLAARSFERYGTKLAAPEVGCIAVFPRGKKSWEGHVGIVAEVVGSSVVLLGGNQGNAVSLARYPIAKAVAWRWPPQMPAQPKVKDVIAVSRKATWISRLTKALHAIWMSLGLGSVMEWLDTSNSVFDQVSEVVRNNALALAIGGAILGALALKYVLALMVEDVKDGRSTPSGTTN